MIRLLLAAMALTGMVLSALPAAAQAPAVHLQLPGLQGVEDAADGARVPHRLGPITEDLAALTAPLPGPEVAWSAEGLIVRHKESAGALVVPNLLNAGATRMDESYIYLLELGVLSADLGHDLATAQHVFAEGSGRSGLRVPHLGLDMAPLPPLQFDLDLAGGSLNACAVTCAPHTAKALAAALEGRAGFARADGFAAPLRPEHREELLALPADGAPASPAPGPAPAARAAPLASQSAGPATESLAVAQTALLAATLVLGALVLGPLALYSKIRRDATLLNDTRRGVYDAVVAQPGLSIQEVARRGAISHSTAAYHLDRLAAAGLVVATADGNKVRYYRNGGRFTEQERRLLPCLENAETVRVLEAVLQRPWTYRAEIAELLGITATTVNWHLRRLFACSVLTEAREGRSAYLFVERAGLAQACAGLLDKTPPSPARDAAGRVLALLGHAGLPLAPAQGPSPQEAPRAADPRAVAPVPVTAAAQAWAHPGPAL